MQLIYSVIKNWNDFFYSILCVLFHLISVQKNQTKTFNWKYFAWKNWLFIPRADFRYKCVLTTLFKSVIKVSVYLFHTTSIVTELMRIFN